MKKNYFFFQKLAVLFAVLALGFSAKAQLTVQIFNYTGSIQTFTVPTCVYSMTVQVKGAEGGYHASSSIAPGLGADMKGVITVTPGQVLKILVGQQPY